jgi:carbon-monoxide dehydrogenase medium subunit
VKPAPFDYARATDVAAAVKSLADAGGMARVIAGGQSLGPMLNLRLAQPQLLVDVRGIDELRRSVATPQALTVGACVTHAAIEDGAIADTTRGLMRSVARDIGYRAVRNRGTIGGSLCHADPAGDWVSALLLLDASVCVAAREGERVVPATSFVTGAYATALGAAEMVTAIRIPPLSAAARWSYYKFCRKPGEFAEAIAGFVVDPERRVCRGVIGATHGAPHAIEDASELLRRFETALALEHVRAAGLHGDDYEQHIHVSALKRAAARLAA